MKTLLLFTLVGVLHGAWVRPALASPIQWHSDDPLSLTAFDGDMRVKFSGLLDLEAYSLPDTAPGLIYSDESFLLNPRLSLFMDGQIGSKIYFFTQARLDRGFDPANQSAQVRLDEYAVRFTPWDDGRLSIQVGKFATIVGNWAPRHLSWDNPFITAPLPYENLTGIWDMFPVDSPGTLLGWGHVPTREFSNFGNGYFDKAERLPVIWGPSYATGASVAGKLGKFEYAAEIKNSSLSSRPESWDLSEVNFSHPTFSGRLGYRPNMAWNLGLSASSGPYLNPEAGPYLPPGKDTGDYQQRVIGQDISFEWHHLQIWSEIYASRFEVPTVGNADTLAYYIEAKYKFTPQLFGALRWNQQFFGDIAFDGEQIPWGRDMSRLDASLGCRLTTNLQIKLQYSIQSERWAESSFDHMLGAQITLKF